MIKIPDSITQFLRRAKVGEDELTILADGLYICDTPVRLHIDGDHVEKAAYGVILLNDDGLLIAQGDRLYDAPVGSTYRVLGHESHGALLPPGKTPSGGRIAFIAFDVLIDDPRYESWPSFEEDAAAELEVLAAELTEPR